MSDDSKNIKAVPLRVSQLLPDILAIQDEEEDYGSESDGEYPDKSFSDGDIVDHNRGFYKCNFKTDVTHPISNNRSLREHYVENNFDDNLYSQTYPNKDSHSASKNKSKLLSTPLKTPNKHNIISKQVTASGRCVRGGHSAIRGTPCSSSKKKTPRYMKGLALSSTKGSHKKSTPFRKCLNLEEGFKSSTKVPLLSSSKSSHPNHPCSTIKGVSEKGKRTNAVPTSLDEIFASSLHITNEQREPKKCASRESTGRSGDNKANSFINKMDQRNHPPIFATPKTSVTSNSIIKGCRDNFMTPLKSGDLSGLYRHETPGTQNRSLHKNQQPSLFTINETKNDSLKQSAKKVETSQQEINKENKVTSDEDIQHEKSLFQDRIKLHNKVTILKEMQNQGYRTPSIDKSSNVLKQENPKKLIADPRINWQDNLVNEQFVNNVMRSHPKSHHQPDPDQKPHCFSSQTKPPRIVKNEQPITPSVFSVPFEATKGSHHYFLSNNSTNCDKNVRSSQPEKHFNPVTDNYLESQQQQKNSMEENVIRNSLPSDNNQQCSVVDGNVNHRMAASENGSSQMRNSNKFSFENNLRIDGSHQMPYHRSHDTSAMQTNQQIPGISRLFKTLTIKSKQYIVLGSLGTGGSSEVFKVMDPENSAMYAVKCVNLAVEQSVAQSYVNEIKLLQRLQGSDRVVTMYDYEFLEKKRTLYVILEMGDVDLSKLMKDYRASESRLPLPILMCYWTEMLTAVRHIHQNGIIHSDLKPANFLLVRGRLKLIDFGIASSINADATSVLKDSATGTFNYISPEAVNAGMEGRDVIKISYKSDVWSLGCILYSMLYGRTPFSHIPHIMAKVRALCNPDQVIDYPEVQGVPQVLMHALRWCLTYNVKERPNIQQLIDLPYMGEGLEKVPRGMSSNRKKLPLSIILKIKETLTQEELACFVDVLEGN